MAGWTCPDRNDIEWDGIISATKGFNTSGNVGIGTSAPGADLEIFEPSGSAIALRIRRDASPATTTVDFLTPTGNNGEMIIKAANTNSAFIATKIAGNFSKGDWKFYENVFFDKIVGIGTTSPDPNAILELSSTTKAFLPPRMTTTQRDALTATNGMIIYNSTTDALNYYKAGIWTAI